MRRIKLHFSGGQIFYIVVKHIVMFTNQGDSTELVTVEDRYIVEETLEEINTLIDAYAIPQEVKTMGNIK